MHLQSNSYDSTSSSRKVQRAVRGLVNELYIDDLRCKTLRGQTGQVERGFVAGGKSYGYDIVKTDAGSDYVVSEEQAHWVQFIFEKFAAGWSTFQICDELNRLNVPSPRNSTWMRSALYGSPRKGSGILNNSTYIGIYIWNRSQWIKDPDTGVRVRVQQDRPQDEWKTVKRDHYRIISDELWSAVRARMGADRLNAGTSGKGGFPKSLFGGLLRCPKCGGAMVSVNRRYYGCVTRKERGAHACEGMHIFREQTDERLLNVLRQELCSDEAQADIDSAVRRFFAAELLGAQETEKQAKDKIESLTREIGNLTQALAEIGISAAIIERLEQSEAEREKLTQLLARTKGRRDLFTEVSQRVRQKTLELKEALTGDATNEAKRIIATLMGPIGIEQKEDAYFASYNDISKRLLVCAAENVSYEKWLRG